MLWTSPVYDRYCELSKETAGFQWHARVFLCVEHSAATRRCGGHIPVTAIPPAMGAVFATPSDPCAVVPAPLWLLVTSSILQYVELLVYVALFDPEAVDNRRRPIVRQCFRRFASLFFYAGCGRFLKRVFPTVLLVQKTLSCLGLIVYAFHAPTLVDRSGMDYLQCRAAILVNGNA